jgi:hemoglobin-like flavoprotein
MLLDAIDKVIADIDPIAEDWEARKLACVKLAHLCRDLESGIYAEMKQRVRPLKDLLN